MGLGLDLLLLAVLAHVDQVNGEVFEGLLLEFVFGDALSVALFGRRRGQGLATLSEGLAKVFIKAFLRPDGGLGDRVERMRSHLRRSLLERLERVVVGHREFVADFALARLEVLWAQRQSLQLHALSFLAACVRDVA